MIKTYEVYLSIHSHETLIKVNAECRADAIKEATRQFIERHVLHNIVIYRANALGKEIPTMSPLWGKSTPTPDIKVVIP